MRALYPNRVASGLVILLAVGGGSLAAQQEADRPAEIFFETIDVNVVNLEVYVTDRQGNPVTDLTREDFELFEDGRRIPITNFFRVEGGRIFFDGVPTAEGAVDGEVEAETGPRPLELAELPVPEEQRLHLVVLIDNLNIRPFNRNRVFQHLRSFLHGHLTRDDRVMLVTFERSLNIRRPFTYDPMVVAEALDEIERVSAHGVHADSDRHDILRAIEEAEVPAQILSRMEKYAESLYHDLATTVTALRDFVDSLAGVPGRKAVLYVSDGLPLMAAEDVYTAANARFPGVVSITEVHRFNIARRLETLATQANANRVTFYTLDAAGLRAPEAASVRARQPGLTPFIETVNISNRQSSLRLLAEKTGGRAILNTNNFTPDLDRIAVDFGNYYSLGYTPAHAGDGRYHRVSVRVNRRGVDVRHREGYRSKPLRVRMANRVEGALVYDLQSNPLDIRVRVAGTETAGRDTHRISLEVLIPTPRVVLFEQGGRYVGRLRLYLSAMDFDGGHAPVEEVELPLELSPEERARPYLIYPVELLMRSGHQRIAVGVWDEIAASASFVTEVVRVGGR